jgi:glutathione peroxidase
MKKSFFEFKVQDSKSHEYDLIQHKGKVVLAVNVASKCGFTPQYKGLEKLYQDFKNDQFIILGFPCNQFGGQEPGSDSEIQSFCELNYGVTFPVLAKIEVNGDNTAEVFKHLKKEAPGLLGTQMIKWNFTKFLINKKGEVIKRYSPNTDPLEISEDIKKALAK